MGRIVISTNTSLDGIVQDPDGQEGFRRGGWFGRFGGADLDRWREIEFDEALRADTLLLGRHSYEWFAGRWSARPGDWADRLRTVPKFVVSSTLTDPGDLAWTNTTIVDGDAVTAVAKLKDTFDGDIVVYASYQLGQALLEHDLVDEFRLFVFPVVLGSGRRLFGDTAEQKALRLASSRLVGEGLVLLTHEVMRD